MSRTGKLLFFGSLIALGCGGQIVGADGGVGGGDSGTTPPTASSSVPPSSSSSNPPPPLCSPMSGGGTTSTNGDCTVSEKWTCGTTTYTVDCTCPQKTCSCSQYTSNGGSGTTVPYYNGCPACAYTGTQLAQLCGFPSQ